MKPLLLAVILLLSFSPSRSQQWSCADDAIEQLNRSSIKNYDELLLREQRKINDYIARNFTSPAAHGIHKNPQSQSTATYLIPVVFHVVHDPSEPYGTGTNIPYSQILSQINAMNAAFARDYPNYNGETHPAYAENSDIQFCMARITAPASAGWYNGPGGVEYGVMRYPATAGQNNHSISAASAGDLLALTHPAASYFPFSDYLNIWVVSTISGSSGGTTMGYAPRPIMSSYPLDGLVIRADICGDNSTGNSFPLGFGLQEGKVACHEIGHYFGLYHIFQGGCAGMNAAGSSSDACDLNGDYICDIEPATTTNVPCGGVYNTCTANYATGTTANDMVESYMSYSDDNCMNTFTMNQCQRMWATLGSLRSNLWSVSNLIATGVQGSSGCVPPYLVSAIQFTPGTHCTGAPIAFSNPTSGNTATSWNWSFPGGSPSSSTSATVNVTYAVQGLHTVYLTVSDGSLSITDSAQVAVIGCTLDSSQLHRSNWFFGSHASMDFSTGTALANDAANVNNTMDGFESAVSMSDEHGNLLFYSDGKTLWNASHQAMNIGVLFPWNNSTVPGLIAAPYPGHPGQYYIVSAPPSYTAASGAQYVLVDVNANTVTTALRFTDAALANVSEVLTIVPHCNGYDYWIIIRGSPNDGRFYSILLTAEGLSPNAVPLVSANFAYTYSGQLKGNHAGTKLIQAIFGGASSPIAVYDFDAATGVVSNQVYGAVCPGHQVSTGVVYSAHDSVIYVIDNGTSQNHRLFKYDAFDLSIPPVILLDPIEGLQMEMGPDNNIYIAQTDWNVPYLDMIINADSYANCALVQNAVNFSGIVPVPPYYVSTHVFCGTPNFIDAQRPELLPDFTYAMPTCMTVDFSVDPCWQIYSVQWDFGDGSLATGLNVSHTYALAGNYTVSMILSHGTAAFPAVTHVVNVFVPGSGLITGPDTVCTNALYPSVYSVPLVNGATYTWTSASGSITGPSNGNTVSVSYAGAAATHDTLSVICSSGGCSFISTLIVQIFPPPNAEFYLEIQLICDNEIAPLTGGLPPGGYYMINGVVTDSADGNILMPGLHPVSYIVTNAAGCFAEAVDTIRVVFCTDVDEPGSSSLEIFPNPVGNELIVYSQTTVFVEVYNMLGEKIFSAYTREEGGMQRLYADVSEFSPGMYLVHVEGKNLRAVRKFVKE